METLINEKENFNNWLKSHEMEINFIRDLQAFSSSDYWVSVSCDNNRNNLIMSIGFADIDSAIKELANYEEKQTSVGYCIKASSIYICFKNKSGCNYILKN